MIGRMQSFRFKGVATSSSTKASIFTHLSNSSWNIPNSSSSSFLVSRSLSDAAVDKHDEEEESSSGVVTPQPNRNFVKVNELLVEDIPTEGEWAGCSKKFMAPLRVPVRGGGMFFNSLFELENMCIS